MNFRAFVRRNSWLFNQWRAARRIGGVVSDVRFKWDGKDYVSVEEPLSPGAVAVLLHNNMIQLALMTEPVGELFPASEPEPEPEPEKPIEVLKPISPRITLTLPPRPPKSR